MEMKEKTPFLQNEVNNILLFTYYANCNKNEKNQEWVRGVR